MCLIKLGGSHVPSSSTRSRSTDRGRRIEKIEETLSPEPAAKEDTNLKVLLRSSRAMSQKSQSPSVNEGIISKDDNELAENMGYDGGRHQQTSRSLFFFSLMGCIQCLVDSFTGAFLLQVKTRDPPNLNGHSMVNQKHGVRPVTSAFTLFFLTAEMNLTGSSSPPEMDNSSTEGVVPPTVEMDRSQRNKINTHANA